MYLILTYIISSRLGNKGSLGFQSILSFRKYTMYVIASSNICKLQKCVETFLIWLTIQKLIADIYNRSVQGPGSVIRRTRDYATNEKIKVWLLPNVLMTAWLLPENCLMTVWWLSDDCPMTVRWLSDDCPMTVRWLSDDCKLTVMIKNQMGGDNSTWAAQPK